MDASQLEFHFDAFYEDIFCEMFKYGELEEFVVCDNNNNDRKLFPRSLIFSCFREAVSTNFLCFYRPHRERLRAFS